MPNQTKENTPTKLTAEELEKIREKLSKFRNEWKIESAWLILTLEQAESLLSHIEAQEAELGNLKGAARDLVEIIDKAVLGNLRLKAVLALSTPSVTKGEGEER